MQSNTVEVLALFDRDIRYLVPIFQRNYRWNEADHWAPLWQDVRGIAEDILDYGEGFDISDHFLGAIVCEQLKSFGRDAHAVGLIDGQQRITTLQLLLAAASLVSDNRGFDEDADYLRKLVANSATVVKERPEHRYKVLPNVADRSNYQSAMTGGAGQSAPQRAVEYFTGTIDRWLEEGDPEDPLDDADNTPEERMQALITALTRHVLLVKIDLEPKDNAQVIFETLNARGERLTDADLIRNFLFRRAEEEGQDAEALHATYWKPFDDPEWSRRVAHGRHQRERLHMFINHWLSMRRIEEIPAATLFRAFKEFVGSSGETAETVAKNLSYYATVFENFDRHAKDSFEWWFFRRIDEMDLITVYPVLLWLFGHEEDDLPKENRQRALRAIESYLVRRLLRRDSTRSYGLIFIDVLKAAAKEDPPAAADARIIRLLASNTADTDKWPTDVEMRSAILNTNVYKLKQSRLKMVLEGIERRLVEGGRTESVSLGHNLWIEHVMPQGWRTAAPWSLSPDVEDATLAGVERDHIIHTLGNLTLTTSKLDIELSNRPWQEKLRELEKHSGLQLNRDVCQKYAAGWDEGTIRQRGDELTEAVVAIWPGPRAMLAEVP